MEKSKDKLKKAVEKAVEKSLSSDRLVYEYIVAQTKLIENLVTCFEGMSAQAPRGG